MVERLTRPVVYASMLMAISVEVIFGQSIWRWLPEATALAFAGAWWGARRAEPIVPAVLLVTSPIAPALFLLFVGTYYHPLLAVWFAALLGTVTADMTQPSWAFPPRLKPFLIFWLLVVALSWPVVAAREMDFTLAVLHFPHMSNTGAGGGPVLAVTWIASVALTHGGGLLWFDWLWRHHSPGHLDSFERRIALPLGVGAFVAALVGVYQGLVDITAFSAGTWASQHRAAGPLGDANPFGMLVALWAAGWLVLAGRIRSRAWWAIALVACLASLMAVWASGSRTALAAAVLGPLFTVATVFIRAPVPRLRARVLAAVGAVAVIGTLSLYFIPFGNVSPIARLRATLPPSTPATAEAFLREMWERNRFGTAAVGMIRDHPWTGVGVGAFHMLVVDYTYIQTAGILRLTPDNAQNWYRHQLAELGVLGSLGWIAWVVWFGWFLGRTRGTGDRWVSAVLLKGALLAFAVMSLVGVPAQDPAVTFLFWTFAFWYIQLVRRESPPPSKMENPSRSVISWHRGAVAVAVVACLAAHLTLTVRAARADLRVPNRAVRANWRYQYGFLEPGEVRRDPEYRWATQHAVAVLPNEGPWLRLVVVLPHPDVRSRPVHTRVVVNGRPVIDALMQSADPETIFVPIEPAQSRVMIETDVSRTWRDSGPDGSAVPAVGLGLRWSFSTEKR